MMKVEQYTVTGMTCAACRANVTAAVNKCDGVINTEVNLITGRMKVEYDSGKTQGDLICSAVRKIGYGIIPYTEESFSGTASTDGIIQSKEIHLLKKRVILSAIFIIPLIYIAMGHMISLPLPAVFSPDINPVNFTLSQLILSLVIIIINRKIYISGVKGFIKFAMNMDTLVAIGSLSSFAYGIYCFVTIIKGNDNAVHSLYFESSAMVPFFVSIGKLLEKISCSGTNDALEKLKELRPDYANIITDIGEETVRTDSLEIGDTVIIRAGNSIPADGTVISGTGWIDASSVTGESMPVLTEKNNRVICGTVNTSGSFTFKVEKTGNETSISRIIRLVEEAGSSKAPVARIADKVSRIFVPTVIAISLLTFIIWIISTRNFSTALNCAVSVLFISCPCALGLATPIAVMVGSGKAAENGILFKSAEAFETLAKCDTVIFDKTGTLTEGKPAADEIILLNNISREDFITTAASAESGSSHPLSAAITSLCENNLISPENYNDYPGLGITATVNNVSVKAGNLKFFQDELNDETIKIYKRISSGGATPVIFTFDGKPAGIISIRDKVKKDSVCTVKWLRENCYKTVMLTGDNSLVAASVAEKAGIDEFISDVLPDFKAKETEKLKSGGNKVIMVGDGINDAPALTVSDVGIAVGNGTDIAIDSADIVFVNSSLLNLCTATELSKAMIRNVKVNLFWAFFYNIIGIPLAAGALIPLFGISLSPIIGSAAMSCSSLCVVFNALRLKKFKTKFKYEEENNMTKTIFIDGMMCNHCKMHVENALKAVNGVESVLVSLEDKNAVISGDFDIEAAKKAVTDDGYTVIDVK